MKISKQLGVKSTETEERLLELLLRIDNGRPKKFASSVNIHRTISPGKKCEGEKKLSEFGVKFKGKSSSGGDFGGKGKDRRALLFLNEAENYLLECQGHE